MEENESHVHVIKEKYRRFCGCARFGISRNAVFACDSGADRSPDVDEGNSALKNGVVKITSVSDGVQKYDGAEVYIEDEKLELYNVKVNNEHRWNANPQNRSDSGVGYFSLDGKRR